MAVVSKQSRVEIDHFTKNHPPLVKIKLSSAVPVKSLQLLHYQPVAGQPLSKITDFADFFFPSMLFSLGEAIIFVQNEELTGKVR